MLVKYPTYSDITQLLRESTMHNDLIEQCNVDFNKLDGSKYSVDYDGKFTFTITRKGCADIITIEKHEDFDHYRHYLELSVSGGLHIAQGLTFYSSIDVIKFIKQMMMWSKYV